MEVVVGGSRHPRRAFGRLRHFAKLVPKTGEHAWELAFTMVPVHGSIAAGISRDATGRMQ